MNGSTEMKANKHQLRKNIEHLDSNHLPLLIIDETVHLDEKEGEGENDSNYSSIPISEPEKITCLITRTL